MNWSPVPVCRKQFFSATVVPIGKRMMAGALALSVAFPAMAQNSALQEKLAAVQQSMRKTSRNCASISGSKRRSSL